MLWRFFRNALPFGEGGPVGPGEVRVLGLQHWDESVLRTGLIRPSRALHVEAPSPKGKALVYIPPGYLQKTFDNRSKLCYPSRYIRQ